MLDSYLSLLFWLKLVLSGMLHFYETLGFWRRSADVKRIHVSECTTTVLDFFFIVFIPHCLTICWQILVRGRN